mmetsp:Transcript_38077/g.101472  ORF Transcript_38077/g.101472 Transcript_38077/m.101472 type:complete len:81 (+) Transcript_38077:210-452(+)
MQKTRYIPKEPSWNLGVQGGGALESSREMREKSSSQSQLWVRCRGAHSPGNPKAQGRAVIRQIARGKVPCLRPLATPRPS